MSYRFGYPSRYGFGGAAGAASNFCVVQGTDLTWYGAEGATYGFIDPVYTPLGQVIYSFKWKADGSFVMSFGVAGNEQVPDTDLILVEDGADKLSLVWNSTTLIYEGSNVTFATRLISEYVLDEVVCMYVQIVPNQFIGYDFSVLRGTA